MTATTNPRLGGKANTPYIIAQVGTPIGIAPTGTMAANGAVTLGTALNTTYSGGLWLYYPSGAVYSGSVAGFFWTVMSSTTLGTVYDNVYVPGTNSWDIPASPTAIVAAGPGAFTGSTSEITAVSVTLPGGSLGSHGALFAETFTAYNNSAGTKISRFKCGGQLVTSQATTTTTVGRNAGFFYNMGGQAKNVVNPYQIYGVTNASVYTSINTAADATVIFTLQIAAATDHLTLENAWVEVRPS